MIKNTCFTIFIIFTLQACKIAEPTSVQVAKPLEVGFVKGPGVVSFGKFYFMENEAVYQPYKLYFINFQKARNFPYAEIDTAQRSKLFGLLPVIENLKMKNGRKYKLRINHKYKLGQTLNGLKNKTRK